VIVADEFRDGNVPGLQSVCENGEQKQSLIACRDEVQARIA